MQDEVKVSQADREAYLSMNTLLQKYRDDVMAGEWDSANGMHALARHRQQAERAFEERERKLREAVNELLAAQDAIDNWSAHTEGQEWCEALFRRQRAFLAVSQALKETPDAQ